MQATLLVLAAGMGSRYGGLKQLDPMGPSGETLLDYSLHDAIHAGFSRVVFVIRRVFEQEFRERVGRRYEGKVDVGYVFQETDSLPDGFQFAGRQKPWGTGHAIWCARDAIAGKFAAINADDFYGSDAFRKLKAFFDLSAEEVDPAAFAMVGYRLGRTLSDHGSVARGVCNLDEAGNLLTIRECTGLVKSDGGAVVKRSDGTQEFFGAGETVSMNFWGFTAEVFPLLESRLVRFIKEKGAEPKAEFYIPEAVAGMVQDGTAKVMVLQSEDDWFGVTYREDKPTVMESLEQLVSAGRYPRDLSLTAREEGGI
jgi:dTDP-glucose pyrophosphorylase